MKVVSKAPLNAETPLGALKNTLTPNDVFYVRNHFSIPKLQIASWNLLVRSDNREWKFKLDDLKQLPRKTIRVVLECAGNGRSDLRPAIAGTAWGWRAVGQADFTGVGLRTLIGSMMELPTTDFQVVFYGADRGKMKSDKSIPYARSLPLREALDPNVLLAWEMNAEPLSPEHGFPLRLVVPGFYGMASVKWLERIELVNEVFDGYFQSSEYMYRGEAGDPDAKPVGEMRPKSLITSHQDGDIIAPGDRMLSGIAWSGMGSISAVSVSLDKGETWLEADLDRPKQKYAWTKWSLPLKLKSKMEYHITVIASDETGATQPLEQYWNAGGYGNNKAQSIYLHTQ